MMKDESESQQIDTTLASSAMMSASQRVDNAFSEFSQTHPSLFLSRALTSEIERQNINVN